MKCDMCLEHKDLGGNIGLYVFGSEGIRLCIKCEMLLCAFVREVRGDVLRKKRDAYRPTRDKEK